MLRANAHNMAESNDHYNRKCVQEVGVLRFAQDDNLSIDSRTLIAGLFPFFRKVFSLIRTV